MYTSAQDWIDRFKKAGCRIELDAVTMRPPPTALSCECEALWSEIRGLDNRERWGEVLEAVRREVGPYTGFTPFPPNP